MIVSLAELRQQRTAATFTPEFDAGDPRRLNPLSLEQQKKRAKELLQALRAHDLGATGRFRRHCPPTLLSGREPKLSDAQFVIAREYGFSQWSHLKAHTDQIRVARLSARKGQPSALDGACRALHIRCGHDIMHKLAIAGFEGDFLWFADPYIEGPVPPTASVEAFVRVRAKYLEEACFEENAFEQLYASYQSLEHARQYGSVNIWLEHDSYDQLILAKLLDFFSDPAKRPPQLRLICVTQFPGVERFNGIGQLPPEALRVLWNDFADVDERQFLLGRQAWRAITAPTPNALSELAKTGTPALPTMSRALTRHLQQLPSVENGLNFTEQLTLQILNEKGSMAAGRLFGWYTNHYEPLVFMGDTGYWSMLRHLANARQPALRIDDGSDLPREWNPRWQVQLLPLGKALLQNNADWLKENAVERWVGGVRIDSRQETNWRFDKDSGDVLRQ
jgi:hypothetical protein